MPEKVNNKKNVTGFHYSLEWPSSTTDTEESIATKVSLFHKVGIEFISIVDTPPEIAIGNWEPLLQVYPEVVAHIGVHLRNQNDILALLKQTREKKVGGVLLISGGGLIRRLLLNPVFIGILRFPRFLHLPLIALFKLILRLFSPLMEILWPNSSSLIQQINPAISEFKLSGKPLQSSLTCFDLIKQNVQDSEQLKPSLLLVDNPNFPSLNRLQRKLAKHPTAIITQPPLRWRAFLNWQKMLGQQPSIPRILVGVPIIASEKNLRFWFALTGCLFWFIPGTETFQLWRQFAKAEKLGKEAFNEFSIAWSVNLIKQLKKTPHISGVHLMPLNKWRNVEKVIQQSS